MEKKEKRYIGLDVHKHYLVALGVDADLNVVLPMRRVELSHLESWMKKNLTQQDEVVLEMTTNTWQLYDELVEYAGSVTVVHPPHVALITRSQVMNEDLGGDDARGVAHELEPGSARTARTGGAASEDDAPGNTGEEPSARGDSTSPLETARGKPLRENEQWLVAGIDVGQTGKDESAERPGNAAIC